MGTVIKLKQLLLDADWSSLKLTALESKSEGVILKTFGHTTKYFGRLYKLDQFNKGIKSEKADCLEKAEHYFSKINITFIDKSIVSA